MFWMDIKDTQCPAKLLRREAAQSIHSQLCVADLAFDVNLIYSLIHAGFKVVEIPIEWTDKIGSKVSSALFRSSLTMFLSVVRVRLIYWPWIYKCLRPLGLGPLETLVYKKLRAPLPLPGPTPGQSPESKV